MKQVAGRLRLDLAQYRELAAFAQFGTTELDKATVAQLERGKRTTEVLKQPQYVPMPVGKQVAILYAVVNGYLDDVPVEKIGAFDDAFHRFMETNHPDIGSRIAAEEGLSPDVEEELKKAITEFKQTTPY
jgi:F-type H+-transporting ATPase subunit alpha